MTELKEVQKELDRALSIHGDFKSGHEAVAVIREEYLEFEKEVFWGSKDKAIAEAIQLAAMAVKYIQFARTR